MNRTFLISRTEDHIIKNTALLAVDPVGAPKAILVRRLTRKPFRKTGAKPGDFERACSKALEFGVSLSAITSHGGAYGRRDLMPQLIGEILVHLGVMTPEQVETVLAAQKAGDKRLFGQIALALGFIEDNSLKRYADFLDQQNKDRE